MTDHTGQMRIETDSLGQFDVPVMAAFGSQTQRAVQLYPVAGAGRFSDYPALLIAMLRIKKVAAQTNMKIGALQPDLSVALVQAIDSVLADPQAYDFPVHALHGGGGISFNMNVNEVLANIANRRSFSADYGRYAPIHPNDHANLNHATSDCFATACHMAVREVCGELISEISELSQYLRQLGAQWAPQRKLARTCLQDAVDIGFNDYFGGIAAGFDSQLARVADTAQALRSVNLGGNIIGRPGDCDAAFFDQILPALNAELVAAGQPGDLIRASNLFAASQGHETLLALGAVLDQMARGLLKFAKDLRLMASGPHGGLGEIALPAMQPGSSAIPGKINPTVPEFMVQCAMAACGKGAAIAMTQDHGELDYNPWQAVVVTGLLDMIGLLTSGVASLRVNCLQGLQPNAARNTDNATSLLPSLIRLKQLKGYSFASDVAKQAQGDLKAVRAAVIAAQVAATPSTKRLVD
ncbi:lyase family protein [Loktanella salsilacus]|uniref:lyase family protein n=1 Tax=Loktanella salsilacus TaxID=195913 RepID=UPI0037359C48